jgi:hypothetical protein
VVGAGGVGGHSDGRLVHGRKDVLFIVDSDNGCPDAGEVAKPVVEVSGAESSRVVGRELDRTDASHKRR